MRNLSRYIFLGLILTYGVMFVIGCSNSESSSNSGPGIDNGVNTSPTASITVPVDGTIYDEGDYITFTGNCNDTEEGALSGNSVSWASNSDGHLGVGTTISMDDLSTGTHIITLVATDSKGASASDSVTIAVNPEGNTIPTAEITSPSDQDEFEEGDNIAFTGTGSDVEDGALTGGDLVWRSSIDGVIGTGSSVIVNDLSVGSHTITLTATDSDDVFGTDTIMITISSSDGGETYDYIATGTYNYNSSIDSLTINVTKSNFICGCGAGVGGNQATVIVNETTMIIGEPGDQNTWTRDSGTSDDIVGTWEGMFDDGNDYIFNFNSNGDFSLSSNCNLTLDLSEVTIPQATIDFNNGLDDWSGIPVAITDEFLSAVSTDIEEVYLAVDLTNLYVRMDLGNTPFSSGEDDYKVDLDINCNAHTDNQDFNVYYDTPGDRLDLQRWFDDEDTSVSGYPTFNSSRFSIINNSIQFYIPLNEINQPDQRYLRFQSRDENENKVDETKWIYATF